jgi:hypothetical protein
MSELKPCPFCGAGETAIEPKYYWTGRESKILSVEVRHRCYQPDGVRGSTVTMRGKDKQQAIERWNCRNPDRTN